VVRKAIARFGRRLALDASLCAQRTVIQEQMSKRQDMTSVLQERSFSWFLTNSHNRNTSLSFTP
jgi:hypothetical protein